MLNGYAYILAAIFLFTSMEPVSKLVSNSGVQPMDMTFLRFALGGISLLPFAIVMIIKGKKKVTLKDFGIFAGMGIIGVVLSMTLFQFAIDEIGASTAAIIFCSNPVFTTILAHFVLKEKITGKNALSILFCLVGISFFIDLSHSASVGGVLLAVLAAMLFSLYNVIGKKLMSRHTAVEQNSFAFMTGSLILLAIILINGGNPIESVNMDNILIVLYLGVCVSGLGYLSYFYAMKATSATKASIVFFVKPVLAPFFCMALLPNQTIGWRVVFALLFVLIGSYLNTKKAKYR